MARIKAALRSVNRHSAKEEASVIRIHDLVIHPGRRKVDLNGKPVPLTLVEFEILYALAKKPGWVLTRYQIIDTVHGEEHSVTDRSVDVQIAGLRKKLGKAARYVETVRGVGYRFKD